MRGLSSPLISVVIPTLDEEREITPTLDHIGSLGGRWEVVVADGGSRDGTIREARRHALGPRLVAGRGGRAAQCNAGAAVARGDVLLFLHADSRLPADAYHSLAEAWRDGMVGGNFALCFEGGGVFPRILTAAYAYQRRRGYYYGDSSIWVRRDAWQALGGYRRLPVMDDYDLARRLERHGPTRCLPGPARTSDRRWRAMGVPRTLLSWWVIRGLYVAGVPAERLASLYRAVR